MKVVRFKTAVLLILSLFLTSLLQAQEKPSLASSSSVTLQPIEVLYRPFAGLCYSLEDQPLLEYSQFEKLILPVGDYELNRLLKSSETSDSNSKIFGLVGFAGLLTGVVGLLSTPSSQQTPFWVTAIGGSLVFDLGGIFETEAQGTKFNCVQRYNRFARGEEQVLPKGPDNEKSLLNFDSPTPSTPKKTGGTPNKKENSH